MQILYNGSTNVITLAKLFDTVDYEFQEGATVVATLKDSAAANVSGAVNISLAHVAGTEGRGVLYRGEVAHTVVLPGGTEGSVEVTATNTAGKVRKFTEAVRYED